MREIKFRAWDTKIKKLFFVERMSFRTNHDVFRVWDNDRLEEFHIINPDDCILEQYTGLKDIKGKEIYEGDKWKRDGFIGIVAFDFGHWIFLQSNDSEVISYPSFFSNADMGEIIGNIHE